MAVSLLCHQPPEPARTLVAQLWNRSPSAAFLTNRQRSLFIGGPARVCESATDDLAVAGRNSGYRQPNYRYDEGGSDDG